MANTRVPQNFQIRKSSTYTDTTTPTEANFETNPVYLEDDMNNLRSVVLNRSGGSNWWDDFNDGSVNRRKIATLGTDLDVVETKDFLFNRLVLVDIAATTVLQVLTFPTNTPGLGTVPAAVTSGTEGAVATGSANFAATRTSGTAVLASDLFSTGAPNTLRPLNLGSVVDGSTGDPVVTTNGNQMKCLLITERATDGAFGNTASTDRGAIVFVEINATNDGYIYATASDLPASINYTYTERSEFLNLNEWAFLNEPSADAVAGTDVTLTLARTNQSGPVLPNNKDIDWQIGDGNDFRFEDDGNATIASFAVDGVGVRSVTLGTAAGTDILTFEGATFDVNVSNDATFAAGIIVEDGGNQIRVGQTSNTIDNSTGVLNITGAGGLAETATTGNFTMTATTGSMDLQAATAVTIDSSGSSIGVGTDADDGAINVGTGTTAGRVITVGSSTGTTSVNLDAGSGGLTFDTAGCLVSTVTTAGAEHERWASTHHYFGAAGTAQNYLTLNAQNNTTGLTGGMVVVSDATSFTPGDTISASTSTTFTVDAGAPVLSAGDFIVVVGASVECVNGTYQVGSVVDGTITIDTTPTDPIVKTAINHTGAVTGTIYQADLCVIRCNAAGDWEVGDGNSGPITYSVLGTAAGTTLENAWLNATGATTPALGGGSNGFTGTISDGTTYLVTDTDDTETMFSLASVNGADVFTLGHSNEASVLDLNSGTGGTEIDSTGAISLDAAAASNFNTTVGNLTLRSDAGNLNGLGLAINLTGISATAADDITLTAATSTGGGNAGGDVFINSGVGDTTGAGGVIDINGGTGGATDGTGGAINVDAGSGGGTNGSGGALTANAGVAVGTGNGGNLSVNAGDAVTSGSGGTATFTSGSGGTTGSGGDLTIQSGDGGSISGPVGRLLVQGGDSVNLPGGAVDISAGASSSSTGGHVTVTAGDSTTGNGGQVRIDAGTGSAGNGYVRLRNALNAAVTETSIIATFENQGTGTGGGANVSFYTEDPTTGSGAVPSHLADSGSLYWQQRTGLAPRLFMNTSTGTSGTTWSQIDVGGVSGSLEAAWEAATGAGAILGNGDASPNSFTGSVSDTFTYLINTTTGSHTLLSLGAVSGGDVVTVGHNNEAAVLNLDSGTGGTSMDSTGAISITADAASDFTVDSAALTLSTTTSGAVNVTAADDVVVTSGAGDAIDLNTGTATTAGATGGAYTLDTGAGAAGTPGVVPVPAGNGGGGTVVLGNGANGTGTAVVAELAADAGAGGSFSLTAGDGGDGAAGTEDAALPGAGGNISLTAGDGGADTGLEGTAAGGSIFLTAGAAETATAMGRINLRTPTDPGTVVTDTVEVVRLINQGAGTRGGGQFDMFVADNVGAIVDPAFSALTGSLYVANSTTEGSALYLNTSTGTGTTTGSTWGQVVTADPTAGARQFAQVILNRAITGSGTESTGPTGTNLRQADCSSGTMPTRASGHDFDTQSEIYFNGVLMMNGTGNDVKVATLGATTVDIHLLAGANLANNDIVTIVYYNI
jgi:hypothetical protein